MTSTLYDLYGSNKDKESAGSWFYPAGEGKGMPGFKLARAGGSNKQFTKAQMAALKPYQRLIQANSKSPTPEVLEIVQKAQKESFVAACVLDWENVTSTSGVVLPFSKEAATMLMNTLPDLYDALYEAASSLSTFQSQDAEDEAKNS